MAGFHYFEGNSKLLRILGKEKNKEWINPGKMYIQNVKEEYILRICQFCNESRTKLR